MPWRRLLSERLTPACAVCPARQFSHLAVSTIAKTHEEFRSKTSFQPSARERANPFRRLLAPPPPQTGTETETETTPNAGGGDGDEVYVRYLRGRKVKSYDDLVEWLVSAGPEGTKTAVLPFEGKNVCVYWTGDCAGAGSQENK